MTVAPREPSHWRIVALLFVVVLFGHFNRTCISVAGTEQLIPHHGITKTQMGTVYSAFLILYTLNMSPCGWLTDRIGPRWTLTLMCGGSAVCIALTGMTGFLWTGGAALLLGLIVVRSTMGVFNSPLHPAAALMVARSAPPGQVSLLNALVVCAATVGTAATFPVFGGLMDAVGWQSTFLVFSILTAFLALVWNLFTRGSAGEGRKRFARQTEETLDPAAKPALPPLATRTIVSLTAVTLSYFCLGYFQYLLNYWIQDYTQNVLELSTESSRIWSAAITLANGFGMLAGGWLTDQTVLHAGDYRRLWIVPASGMALSAVFMFLGVATSHATTALVMLALGMAALGLCEGPCWTASIRLGGPRGALAGGIMNTGGNAGGALSPALSPLIAEWTGSWKLSLAVAGGVSLAGAFAWFLVDMRDEQKAK